AEDGIRDFHVTGVQTCALPICLPGQQAVAQHGLRKSDKQLIVQYIVGRVVKRLVLIVVDAAVGPERTICGAVIAQGTIRCSQFRSEERRVGKEWVTSCAQEKQK